MILSRSQRHTVPGYFTTQEFPAVSMFWPQRKHGLEMTGFYLSTPTKEWTNAYKSN